MNIHLTLRYICPAIACLVMISVSSAQNNTVITSERLEMQGSENRNFFTFETDVLVKGTNLEIRCDLLTVVSQRSGGVGEAVGKIGAIETIIAEGDVVIHQAGRTAYAGKAEVDPRSGKVILSDKPKIVDNDVTVEGYQFVLHRGEKKFESIPDPNATAENPSRSSVRLGALPDLGFDQDEKDISIKPEKISIDEQTNTSQDEDNN